MATKETVYYKISLGLKFKFKFLSRLVKPKTSFKLNQFLTTKNRFANKHGINMNNIPSLS